MPGKAHKTRCDVFGAPQAQKYPRETRPAEISCQPETSASRRARRNPISTRQELGGVNLYERDRGGIWSRSLFAAAEESRLKFQGPRTSTLGRHRNDSLRATASSSITVTSVDAKTWPSGASHEPYGPFPYVPTFRLIANVLRLRLKPNSGFVFKYLAADTILRYSVCARQQSRKLALSC
jgi:hypothetical protein